MNTFGRRISTSNLNPDPQEHPDPVAFDGGEAIAAANIWLFEASWEVVNKVGGLHTVLSTKAECSTAEYGDNYCMFGPYLGEDQLSKIELCEFSNKAHSETAATLRSMGITIYCGRWLIGGAPYVVLFDIGSVWHRLKEWKEDFWDFAHIGFEDTDSECNNCLILGNLMHIYVSEFRNNIGLSAQIILHCHEWQAGMATVLFRVRNSNCALIFTTHATLLGRYLAASNFDLYSHIEDVSCDYEAGKREIYARYCIEKASAHCAHVFTTVSEITGYEAKHILGRYPDVITPNGLNIVEFATIHDFQNLHAKYKDKILNFVRGHFHGCINFDLDKTLFYFTAGRYEYRNKGGDIFIESLARLNHRLMEAKSEMTIIAFIIYPAAVNNFNVETLRGSAIGKKISDSVDELNVLLKSRMLDSASRGQLPGTTDLLTHDDTFKLKSCIKGAQRSTLPPICTHNMINNDTDPVLNDLRRCNLINALDHRVKVIFHPEFLNPFSAIIPMEYLEFIRGCHLGIFPSYYEPWGYTPAESVVSGVPNVTTDLSGFGNYIAHKVARPSDYGVYILKRRYVSVEESINQLTDIMYEYSQKNRRLRSILRNRTERLSELIDWKSMSRYYKMARELAIQRHSGQYYDTADNASIGMFSPVSTRPTTPVHSNDEDNEDDELFEFKEEEFKLN